MRSKILSGQGLLLVLACALGAGADAGEPAVETQPAIDPKGSDSQVETDAKPKHTNQLIHATSPYLLQHAHNPVDWYEWGEDAFAKAREVDKPIFLSIGYSACHWCHVMEHECFDVEEIAAIMNQHFVCIKVDREERPDVDEIYMQATLAMNRGQGGWPMSVWLTSDRVPFVAGTYFPPEQFKSVLLRIADAWQNERDKVLATGGQVSDYLQEWAAIAPAADETISREAVHRIANTLSQYFDPIYGGLESGRNKFPPSMAMELMLRVYLHTDDESLLHNVENTLDHMARGGIYDHLGGGICRYSTDPEWLVPHFEKMLYDQALVSSVYLDAYQVTRKPLNARVAREIFDYVIADLQSPEGGFYSTRDADSEGREGKYYIWTVQQVADALGADDARLFCEYYDVTEKGNWSDPTGHAPPGPKNILRVRTPPEEFAEDHGLTVEALENGLAGMRAKLLKIRSQRVPPGLDDKILTAWNGLMIASLAKGANVLDEPKYAEAAAKAADFVLTRMRKEGRLLRTYRQGQARLTGYLNDYAFFIEGLLNLYEATFDARWLAEADALNKLAIQYYFDEAGGGFFFTASDGEALIARSKNPRDGAIPSGNSVQAMNLLRLAVLTGHPEYRAKAESVFRAFAPMASQTPGAFERLLCAVDFQLTPTREVAVVGSRKDAATEKLLDAIHGRYLPNKVVVWSAGAGDGGSAAELIPLLRGKTLRDGRPAVYVCRNYTCKAPITSPEALATQLDVE